MALTRRQKQVVDLIAKFVDENGYSPSYEELAQGLNLASLATVHKHIAALTAKNYLKRGINQSRSLELGPKYVQENKRHRDAAALEVPLDRMLIETDSPYLAPVPYRGKSNEPAYVSYVGRFIAQLREMPDEALAAATTRNFFRLFKIPQAQPVEQ